MSLFTHGDIPCRFKQYILLSGFVSVVCFIIARIEKLFIVQYFLDAALNTFLGLSRSRLSIFNTFAPIFQKICLYVTNAILSTDKVINIFMISMIIFLSFYHMIEIPTSLTEETALSSFYQKFQYD